MASSFSPAWAWISPWLCRMADTVARSSISLKSGRALAYSSAAAWKSPLSRSRLARLNRAKAAPRGSWDDCSSSRDLCSLLRAESKLESIISRRAVS